MSDLHPIFLVNLVSRCCPKLGASWDVSRFGLDVRRSINTQACVLFSCFFVFHVLPMVASTAQMDDANRAICYWLRHPKTVGEKPAKYKDIRKIVRKTDGRKPTIQSIAEVASTYKDVKGQRGRPKGSRNTTKLQDKKIMETFHKVVFVFLRETFGGSGFLVAP